MTLEELFYDLGLVVDAAGDWFNDGLGKLDQGLFMQLTIGQAAFTVAVVAFLGLWLWNSQN